MMRTVRNAAYPMAVALMAIVVPGLAARGTAGISARLPDNVAMELRLYGAVFREAPTGRDDPALIVTLEREGEVWQRAWGYAAQYAHSFHPGRVAAATQQSDGLKLSLVMDIRGDSWAPPAGHGHYEIDLRRVKDGSYRGTFVGRLKDARVKGRAAAHRLPLRGPLKNVNPPARPGEHPRILFRKADLPRLRAKAATPFGKAAMAKMNDAIGLGVKYQLTGERRFAKQAAALCETLMASRAHGSKVERSRPWGKRMEQVSLAYDLCHDAWPAAFRHKVEQYLVDTAHMMFYVRRYFDNHIHWHITSEYPGPILYGAALAGLAIWREKGPAPVRPEPPFAVLSDTARAAPEGKYRSGKGVPISRFAGDRMPAEWIYVGGFKPKAGQDVLASLGGTAKARPHVGAKVEFAGRSETFRPLSHEKDKGYWQGAIDVTNAIGRVYHSTSCFYTVIDNDRPRWVRVETDNRAAKVYLAGAKLARGECVHLDKGPYPMLVVVPIGETRPWGRILVRPRLVEIGEKDAKARLADLRGEYEAKLGDWRFDTAQWRRTGQASVEGMKVFELGRSIMYQYYREAVGTGGFQAGSFSCISMEGPNKYAGAYRTMFGRDVSPYDDVTHYVPRKIFGHVYPAEGKGLLQDINGTPGFRIDAYAEGRDVSGGFLAAMYPIVPDRWKPAALWAWHRHLGVTGPDDPDRILRRGNPAYAFVNYPLAAKATHPSTCMPLAWDAPGHGYCAFRSGWTGGDDFLTQVYAKARYAGGVWRRRNAGTFRVLGLGEIWAHGPSFRLNHFRWMENVVLLPQDHINHDACGRLVYRKLDPYGSGSVTMDLGDVYASAHMTVRKTRQGRQTVKQPLYERSGHVRRASAFKDSGITGLRAIGVDHSGKCGSPYLLAIVDRIRGGKRKVWTWQLGGIQMYGGERGNLKPGQINRGDLDRTRVEGNTFTITKAAANLKATFIAPGPVKLAAETRQPTGDVWFKRDKGAGKGIRMHSNGVFAEGGDDFFVIVTIQRGAAPQVKASGRGLDATVTVGRRKVRFDGKKIVFE